MTTEIEAMLDADARADAINVALPMVGPAHVSASQISQYLRCPRQWAYRQVLGLKVPPNGSLIHGSGVHAAAEAGMLAKMESGLDPDPDESATIAAEYVQKELDGGEVRLYDDDTPGAIQDKAARVADVWAREAAPQVMPTAVEERFDVLMGGIPVTGRLDVVTESNVVDWKTSGKSPSRSDLVGSIQSSIYAAVTGKPISYVYLVNQVKGVKVSAVEFDTLESSEMAALAEAQVLDVAEGMALGVWPRNRNGWHCSQRWCGYFDRCMSGRDDAELRDRAAEARGAAGVMW